MLLIEKNLSNADILITEARKYSYDPTTVKLTVSLEGTVKWIRENIQSGHVSNDQQHEYRAVLAKSMTELGLRVNENAANQHDRDTKDSGLLISKYMLWVAAASTVAVRSSPKT
jgi:hypothetical protein